FPSGRFSGTAFAVRTDPTGAYLVTNRHVVTSEQGEEPVEIGVMFNNSNQFFRATLVRRHPDSRVDLALLRVAIRGGVDDVVAVNGTTPAIGTPVVTIGFPMGTDLQGFDDLSRTGAKATLTAGTVSRETNDLIQVDGYGATGASGSPFFNAAGEVVAVLYGGERESNGRIIYAVPASRIAELLQGE
ncbi:MAG TPA: serine protease, partial [Gemmatimonadales bacterium]|nr:serine protease [Gemmatimonadales bacterium]